MDFPRDKELKGLASSDMQSLSWSLSKLRNTVKSPAALRVLLSVASE